MAYRMGTLHTKVLSIVDNGIEIQFPRFRSQGTIVIPDHLLPAEMFDVIDAAPTLSECAVYITLQTNLLDANTPEDVVFEGPWGLNKFHITGSMTSDGMFNHHFSDDYSVNLLESHQWGSDKPISKPIFLLPYLAKHSL